MKLKRALAALIPVLLLLGLLNNMTVAQVAVPTAVPSIFPSPTVYYVTTAIASPTPGCAAPLPLVNGATAYVKGGVYVRYQPNVSSPFVNYYTEAVTVTIVGGPVCDGVKYNWWQIKGPGNDGWVAEGQPGQYLMRVGFLPTSGCDPAVSLVAGKTAQLLRDLNVHDQPADAGLVLTVASTGATVDVLEGPTCADGYNWWKIRTTVLNVEYTGWVADGQPAGNDWLISEDALNAPVCDSPLELSVGMQAYVNYKDHIPKILRRGPSTNAELVATLFDGIGFTIIGGPFCAEGYNWWQVSILSRPDVTGWLAEGGPANYWISPIAIGDRPL